MRRKVLAAVVLSLGTAWACHQVILTAPSGSTLNLFANPTFICSNGCKSTITAFLLEANTNTPVADGTVVQFFTTLGNIDEQGKTNDGVARVNLVSNGISGVAEITAFSGTATGTLGGAGGTVPTPTPSGSPTPAPVVAGTRGGVVIGNEAAFFVNVSADPPRIRPADARVSVITATVVDESGNFLSGVPVFFTISESSPLEEEIDGGWKFTNSNGQVSVTLRTRRSREDTQKLVVVRATTANGVFGEVTIAVN
jgi:hypothetical protein